VRTPLSNTPSKIIRPAVPAYALPNAQLSTAWPRCPVDTDCG
jgi:hypothetical protein